MCLQQVTSVLTSKLNLSSYAKCPLLLQVLLVPPHSYSDPMLWRYVKDLICSMLTPYPGPLATTPPDPPGEEELMCEDAARSVT